MGRYAGVSRKADTLSKGEGTMNSKMFRALQER